jgi:hypothetical protein
VTIHVKKGAWDFHSACSTHARLAVDFGVEVL